MGGMMRNGSLRNEPGFSWDCRSGCGQLYVVQSEAKGLLFFCALIDTATQHVEPPTASKPLARP